jgi:(1->4)-alpha-D-glucan 1-alpha-D-glucosylmutase
MPADSVLERLLARTAQELAARRYLPEATYRLQFNSHFTFRDATAVVGYLQELGVSTCYASPYLMARPGSLHGYDITDHGLLNPEVGTAEDYAAFVAALRERGMGQVLDVVPNHMGIVGNANAWWNDVLENGRASNYAAFFDIDWDSAKPALRNKVHLPILGDPYGKVLEALQLRLHYETGAFFISYYEHRFPVAPSTWNLILAHRAEDLERELGSGSEAFTEYQSIRTAVGHLPPHDTTDAAKAAERHREKEVIKRRLAALTESAPAVRAFLERTVERFNGGDTGGDGEVARNGHRLDLLDQLLSAQPYRLAWWRVAADEINYRRFFDVNELAALSMERPEVFDATHSLILRLLRTRQVQGLRIDHPDGLFDPGGYLRRLQQKYALEVARDVAATDPDFGGLAFDALEAPLQEALVRAASVPPGANAPGSPAGAAPGASAPPDGGSSGENAFWRPLYVVVEKILAPDEPLPEDWPVHGTTGYEFLNALNQLLVDHDHAAAMTRLYRYWTRAETNFRELVYRKKYLILQVALSSELSMLATQLDRLSEKNRWSRDFTLNSLRRALREVIACFEVYRPYTTGPAILDRDRRYVRRAVERAKRRNPAISGALFDFVRDMLLLAQTERVAEADRREQLRFAGKFQQVSAPVMAKGMEDTAFYVYNRLISLNEVGGDPEPFGLSVEEFHRRNRRRRNRFPHGLSATATHDTKRGEDARARIDVLSEVPRLWQQALARWSRLNKRHHSVHDEETIPDRNDEYFFYQTLVGAWPRGPAGADGMDRFRDRLQEYMQKAAHEAKVHTSWINPNPVFDEALRRFVAGVLDEKRSHRFLADFRAFQRRIDHYALFNSLSQVVLKVASPGVPDVYQGTELWDFSLVDPDNRRPVDYGLRRRLLAELHGRAAGGPDALEPMCRELMEHREDGRVKMYLLSRALHFRRDNRGLFTTGDYLPAWAGPPREDNVCAFVRRQDHRLALAAVGRLFTRLVAPGELPVGAAWGDSVLFLPAEVAGRPWQDVFTGRVVQAAERDGRACLSLSEVFDIFPVALLLAQDSLP